MKAQSQDSLSDQLRNLIIVANQEGLYDAADFISRILENKHAAQQVSAADRDPLAVGGTSSAVDSSQSRGI